MNVPRAKKFVALKVYVVSCTFFQMADLVAVHETQTHRDVFAQTTHLNTASCTQMQVPPKPNRDLSYLLTQNIKIRPVRRFVINPCVMIWFVNTAL